MDEYSCQTLISISDPKAKVLSPYPLYAIFISPYPIGHVSFRHHFPSIFVCCLLWIFLLKSHGQTWYETVLEGPLQIL